MTPGPSNPGPLPRTAKDARFSRGWEDGGYFGSSPPPPLPRCPPGPNRLSGAFRSRQREHLLHQFPQLRPRTGKRPPSRRGDPIILPDPSVHDLVLTSQIPLALQHVEDGIQSSGADLVAVACQLFHQGRSVYRPLGRMEEDMNADESQEQFA